MSRLTPSHAPHLLLSTAMSLVQGYSSDEDDGAAVQGGDVFGLGNLPAAKKMRVDEPMSVQLKPQAAPHVLAEDPLNQTSLITRPTDTQMNVNIRYEDMTLPTQGPENPFSDRNRFATQNALAGHVEEQSMTEHAFRAQHLTHAILGYSMNPSVDESGPRVLGDVEKARAAGFATLDTLRAPRGAKKALKRKRAGKGDLDVVEGDGAYAGPWAAWEGDEPHGGFLDGFTGADGDEDDDEDEEEDENQRALLAAQKKAGHKPKRTGAFGQETSVFHGKSMADYQGRTYMHAPVAEAPGLLGEPGAQECFIPKVCTHTWTGHTQAVAVIRLFPGTGHLMLSGSMDTKIKLWDVYTHQNCLRTFHGHVKAVKDLCFNNDGTQFLSCGYDRQMKLWDTETGACLKRFSNGKIPYCIKFHPDADKQHVFLAGMSDKKIIQYDMNTGEITQEYDQHLGPVNTITFVDENRRFITTSDDKTIRVWDYDIPVVIKYIAEPYMHSMPAVTLHPSNKYFAAQSMDNQILIYSTDNFRQNRKKRFANHQVAGYACQVGFSPDGRWISSGDGSGNVVFWDWKTGNIKSRLKTHSQVVISHVWLPHETVSGARDRAPPMLTPGAEQGDYRVVGRADQAMGLRHRWEGQGRGDRLPVADAQETEGACRLQSVPVAADHPPPSASANRCPPSQGPWERAMDGDGAITGQQTAGLKYAARMVAAASHISTPLNKTHGPLSSSPSPTRSSSTMLAFKPLSILFLFVSLTVAAPVAQPAPGLELRDQGGRPSGIRRDEGGYSHGGSGIKRDQGGPPGGGSGIKRDQGGWGGHGGSGIKRDQGGGNGGGGSGSGYRRDQGGPPGGGSGIKRDQGGPPGGGSGIKRDQGGWGHGGSGIKRDEGHNGGGPSGI
ncbi:hypothetical protein HWV62_44397 [Athelia sp. TMB]|nr:hypothetical protein HWV62_44397 [Athelia sp. TMB]